MKNFCSLVTSFIFVAGLGVAATLPSIAAFAQDEAPKKTRIPMLKGGGADKDTKAKLTADAKTEDTEIEKSDVVVAEAETTKTDADEAEKIDVDASETKAADADKAETETPTKKADDDENVDAEKKDDETMSKETTDEKTPEETEAFRQTMHEGDIALGVCGARVSALMWFYEASVAQGRDDLKSAAASLKESREALKAEAERRAVDDGVDTSVRVMNSESEKIWNDLNEKAGGDEKEFQKTHDELFSGVQECLALFFERPEDEKPKE